MESGTSIEEVKPDVPDEYVVVGSEFDSGVLLSASQACHFWLCFK